MTPRCQTASARIRRVGIRSFLIGTLTILCGCSLLGNTGPSPDLFQLAAPPAVESASKGTLIRLIVSPVEGAGLIDTHRVLFSNDPIERGFYQFASWTEPPAKQFNRFLMQAIEQSKGFRTVTDPSAAVLGDLQLRVVLTEFYHDTSTPPGLAKVSAQCELIDLRTHSLKARRTFASAVDAKQFDARGAVIALSGASDSVLREIVAWIQDATKDEKSETPPRS